MHCNNFALDPWRSRQHRVGDIVINSWIRFCTLQWDDEFNGRGRKWKEEGLIDGITITVWEIHLLPSIRLINSLCEKNFNSVFMQKKWTNWWTALLFQLKRSAKTLKKSLVKFSLSIFVKWVYTVALKNKNKIRPRHMSIISRGLIARRDHVFSF